MKNNSSSIIQAKSITIEEFLNDSKNIVIPRYQRDYSWEKKNVETLLNDVRINYYIGNIIEYFKDNEKEIIDGQQRLITIFLTLIAIYNNTENQELKNSIKGLILLDGKCKMSIKARIANDGSDILEYLIEGNEIPKEFEKKYNELRIYKLITQILNVYNLEEIYINIIKSTIVEIAFLQNEYSAHEMFVNVNTKGKPLDMIEILKSQLFKYLLDSPNSDIYKEEWQEMLKNIPPKQYTSFCSDVFLLDYFMQNPEIEKNTPNGVEKENSLKLIESINNEERAKKIFEFMTGSKIEAVYNVYIAIKNHKLSILKDNYYSNSVFGISFGELDEIWNLYGEFGFKQSDILFITVFYNKEKLIVNNSGFINIIMKYIFMYELYRSVSQNSPASYSNIFKQAADKIINSHNVNDVKEILKQFISTSLIIKESDYESFYEKLIKNDTFNSTKYKTGKFIILMAEEFYTKNLKVEHFIPQNTIIEDDKNYVGCLGNLIPVIKDRYRNNSVKDKLILYEEDRVSSKGINNFLQFGFDEENYREKIEDRSEKLAKKFIDNMKNYYERIMKG